MKLIEKNNKKGITLIALVITIIVLLILAGVSISMLTGDNSLLGNAQKTGPANNIGAAKDEVGLAYNTAMQEYYETKYASTNGTNGTFATKLETAINEITSKGRNHGCGIVYDKDAGTITITNGGYKVIGTVDTADDSAGISWGEMKETTGIDLDKVTLKLNIADDSTKTGTLTATLSKISGDITITWASSDTSIATVSGSNTTATVTGVATGEATITASCTAKGKEYSSTCKVTVIEKKEPNYTGYYADTDGNPDTVEGIIFADLAHNGSGTWSAINSSSYSYSAATSGLKEYYISKESYTDTKTGYGTTGVISAKKGTSGADRFYVMSLSDFDSSEHYWYKNAFGKMSDYSTYTSTAFGKGKDNTKKMIERMKNHSKYSADYGDATTGTNADIWNIIEDKVEQGWFVPSKDEWSAFAVMLQGKEKGLTTSNYSSDFGLHNYYWSSSQLNTNLAWYADFYTGYMSNGSVNYARYVRLASTF